MTKVLPSAWKFGRFGQTLTLPSKTNCYSYKEQFLPAVNALFKQYTDQNYNPYVLGEYPTYWIVKEFTDRISGLTEFYNKSLQFVPFSNMTPYVFFQTALCPIPAGQPTDALPYVSMILQSPISDTLYKDFLNYFIETAGIQHITGLGGSFNDAHDMKLYCAYMSILQKSDFVDGTGNVIKRKALGNTVNCPVDVEVYDKATNELVGRIVNNTVDEEVAEKEHAVVMVVDGDSKMFFLPSDGNYDVKLIGNDSGTMDYTVANIDSDSGETERKNFFDVAITDGLTMTCESSEQMTENYVLTYESGDTLTATEQLAEEELQTVSVDTSYNYGGTITDSMTVTRGDYITLTATADEDYVFAGWYADETLVSAETSYSFVAKENVDLTATFTRTDYTDRIAGDVNRDKAVDLKDITLMVRNMAGGWDVHLDPVLADVNHDSIFNLKDVVLIRRYLAGGWNVELV